jgi:hypothetical protein
MEAKVEDAERVQVWIFGVVLGTVSLLLGPEFIPCFPIFFLAAMGVAGTMGVVGWEDQIEAMSVMLVELAG